ncbi:MAG: cytochrome c biogenesis protein ResB [Candidatus Omnitrophota bacterium]|nr:cytochrome c biogenesis protein ResB [Candidatus Omnitrophota bacterium]
MSLKQTRVWKFFSSIKLAIWLLAIIAALSLLGTFIPQNQEASFYIDKYGHSGYRALLETGLTDVYSSFWFVLLLVLFSINLIVCLINRISLKMRMLGSILSHASILIILIGALIGIFFGQKGLVKISDGEEVSSFTTQDKKRVDLGFSVRLDKFIYSEHIDPKEKLLVCPVKNTVSNGADSPQSDACCSKDSPQSSGKNQGLIAEIPTEIGVEHDIADTGYKIKILRYIPDFAIDTVTKVAASRSAKANNPAIQVQLNDKAGQVSTFWVFARFPDMHQKMDQRFKFTYHWIGRRPKDFISKVTILKAGKEIITKDIRVNEPLRFGGYTFFQFSYDAEDLKWSVLQVVKDPGVGVVYAGFIMLIAGLIIIFYVNPLTRGR